jgi:hypothetical protein
MPYEFDASAHGLTYLQQIDLILKKDLKPACTKEEYREILKLGVGNLDKAITIIYKMREDVPPRAAGAA